MPGKKLSRNRILLRIVLASLALYAAIALSLSGGPSDAQLRSKAVKLVSDRGSCSGEQVRSPSGTDYVLTAAHCRVLEDAGSIRVITEDGRELMRRIVAEDDKSDLLLLEGVPGIEGLPMASSAKRFEHVRTYTHGRGLDTYRTDGVLIESQMVDIPIDAACPSSAPKYAMMDMGFFGQLCGLHVIETYSTAFTAPGSSGGMVVNGSGELVGVVSAGGGGYSLFVTLVDIHRFMSGY